MVSKHEIPEAGSGADRRAPVEPSPVVPGPLRVGSEVSARFLVIVAAVAVVIFLVITLRVLVIPVAIALLLAALLAPAVQAVMRLRIPRGPATAVVLVGGLAALGAMLSFVVTAFVTGLPELQAQLTRSFNETIKPLLAGPPLNIPDDQLTNLPAVLSQAAADNQDALTSGALTTAVTVGELVAGLVLALFVLIFFLYDGAGMWRFGLRMVPRVRRDRVDVAGRRGFASLVGYTRATVLVAVVDAVAIGIGLWIVGVPLVIPLAALVFLGAFVPTVGAVLSGGIAILIALVANGPIPALIVLAIVIGVQQLEGHVLQPLLLGRAVSLHPLAVVLAVAAGLVVAGIVGALLFVPLVAVLNAAIRSLTADTEQDPDAVNPTDPQQASVPGPGTPTEGTEAATDPAVVEPG